MFFQKMFLKKNYQFGYQNNLTLISYNPTIKHTIYTICYISWAHTWKIFQSIRAKLEAVIWAYMEIFSVRLLHTCKIFQ